MTKKVNKKTPLEIETSISLNDMYKATFDSKMLEEIMKESDNLLDKMLNGKSWTVEKWLTQKRITENDEKTYIRAKEAARIKKTKLYKSLK